MCKVTLVFAPFCRKISIQMLMHIHVYQYPIVGMTVHIKSEYTHVHILRCIPPHTCMYILSINIDVELATCDAIVTTHHTQRTLVIWILREKGSVGPRAGVKALEHVFAPQVLGLVPQVPYSGGPSPSTTACRFQSKQLAPCKVCYLVKNKLAKTNKCGCHHLFTVTSAH